MKRLNYKDPEVQASIRREVDKLVDSGKVTPGYKGMRRNDALKVLLVMTNFDESEARFILAMEWGELPEVDKDGNQIIY